MNVTVEDLSSVKKVMHLEVPAADVARELDKAYNEIRRTARIKGFRQGKAPLGVIERLYKKEVHADVAGRLIQETLLEALKDSRLPILGTPQVDPPELAADADYRFDAVFEVKPEIADVSFKGLSLKKTDYQVSEGEIEAQLAMLQRNLATRKPIEEDRPLQDGILSSSTTPVSGRVNPTRKPRPPRILPSSWATGPSTRISMPS